MRTMIIAEAGVNHNGDMEIAKKLIEVAAEAGADYVKFQTYNVDLLEDEAERERLRPYQLTHRNHYDLNAHCGKIGIKFLSTPFDIGSVNFLVDLGVDLIKVPSGEITNTHYLEHIGSLMMPVILSTGMSDMHEVTDAFRTIVLAGTECDSITLMHCTTEYPTPIHHVNLLAMKSMGDYFGVPIGYSDHTLSIGLGACAVALGATVIEKHFTLDRSMPGPDHKASLEPKELEIMVNEIRSIEFALGSKDKRPTEEELAKRGRIRGRFCL